MKRILLIEDDKFYAKQVKQVLEKRLDLQIDWVTSYQEYQSLKEDLTQYRYALVDLVLDDCTDCSIVDELIAKGVPVIVITGVESNELFEKYNKKKIVDFVLKRDMVRLEYLVMKLRILDFFEKYEVLVVEDSLVFQKFLAKFFHIYYPYSRLFFAKSVQEAKRTLEINRSIRLLIVDYMLQDSITGLELVKYIREKYLYEDFGIIALTASEDENIVARFLKGGANDFLHKTFHNFEFVCRIDNVVKTLILFGEVKELAIKDPLTNCYNRRYLYDMGKKFLESYKRQKRAVSIAICDLDHFKKINDTYGHDVGDKVLKVFSKILLDSMRESDFVVRYGGEEFVIFLGDSTQADAFYVIEERIRKRVLWEGVELKDEEKLYFNFSCGICDEGESIEEMIKCADEKLYEAKKQRGVTVV